MTERKAHRRAVSHPAQDLFTPGPGWPMVFERYHTIHNRLLLALPSASLARLRPELQFVELPRGKVIDREERPVEHVYFVNRGFVSMVKTMTDGRSVEVGGVGIEGLTAASTLFGAASGAVLESVVQIAGDAYRIRRDLLCEAMERDPDLWAIVDGYSRFLLGQVAQTAACNRLHSVEERCCRWLLIAHDNAWADRFQLTQEFLAMMLGAQRTSVTLTAGLLRSAGLIDYTRGVITVRDRDGLEGSACECYRTLQEDMNALLAVSPPEAPARAALPPDEDGPISLPPV